MNEKAWRRMDRASDIADSIDKPHIYLDEHGSFAVMEAMQSSIKHDDLATEFANRLNEKGKRLWRATLN